MMHNKLMVAGALLLAGIIEAGAGNSYYVNADIGNDKYDGTSPTILSDTVGPKETLIGALTNAVDGDTVYAAAGVYSNGVYVTSAGLRLRAYVKEGVTLVGEGPDTTFIVGAKDPAGDKNGCGSEAIACVYLNGVTSPKRKGGIIKGFSVSGGRSCKTQSGTAVGIGGASSVCLAVDCVISNNVNVYRGGGISYITCARCVFAGGNKALDVSWSGTAYQSTYFINCLFYPNENGIYKSSSNEYYLYNCTGVNSNFRANDGYRLSCFNCVVYSSHAHHKYVNCLLKGAPSASAIVDEYTRFNLGKSLDVNNNFVTEACDSLIDGDVNYSYDTFLMNFWNIAALEKNLDVYGRPRKIDDAVDIGAVECDAYASTLSLRNLSTVGYPDGITAVDGKVVIPAGSEIEFKWSPPAEKIADEIEYNFTAKVTDGAVLKVTRLGEELLSITAEDGERTFAFTGTGEQDIAFSVSGESGSAELSRFRNSTKVSITDDLGGVDIEGMEIGETEIVNDESITLTISRNYATQKLCTGLIINGEFFSFTGENADNVYTKDIAARDEDLIIKVVYDESGYNTWYVDAFAKDDSGNGRTRYFAKKTLQAAMEIPGLKPGDVVHAAAGRYDAGKYEEKNSSGAVTSRYRVRVAHGVLLEGEGADKTFIVGEIDKTGTKGCGPNAMRCVYMPYDSSITAQNATSAIKGFTVCEGRTLAADGYSHIGGGVCCNDYGYVIDCVISNNAAYRGGGVMSGNYVRCRFVDNSCASTAATDAYNAKSFWDCYCEGGVYSPDRNITCCNCTFKSRVWSGGKYNITLNNCITMYTSSETNSICNNTLMIGKVSSCKSADEKTKKVTEEELALNENGVPGRNSIAVDYGDNALHDKIHDVSNWAVKRLENKSDVMGRQRVYNGTVDVGAHEYDWRGDFAQKLLPNSRFSVAEATSGVTNAVDGIVLTSQADKVVLIWRGKCAGKAMLFAEVDGEGELEVKVAGTVVAADANGGYTFEVPKGEIKIEVSYTGTGSATLKSFTGPKKGTILVVR